MAQRQIIIRRARASDTRIQNRIIWDNNISQMARFSLIAMLSLPDSWDYSVRGMATMLKVSKDTMGKYIKELEAAGYLKRKQVKCEAGRFSNTQYILTDTPGDFGGEEPCPNFSDTDSDEMPPCPNLPDTELPDPEKSPQKKRTKQWSTTKQLPPKAPQGAAGRKSKFDLAEDAKPLLRAYVGGDRELHQVLGDMIENRRELRAINSKRAIKMLLDELDRLSGGSRANKLALLRRAIASSWKTVYPMRPDELPEKIPAGTSTASAQEGGLNCGFR